MPVPRGRNFFGARPLWSRGLRFKSPCGKKQKITGELTKWPRGSRQSKAAWVDGIEVKNLREEQRMGEEAGQNRAEKRSDETEREW